MYVHVGLQLCGEGNLLLTDNATNGTIVSFVNTLNFTEVAQSIIFQGNYIPSSQLCGQFFERCDTSTITRGDQTVLIVPQIGGVGLLLRNGDSNDPQLYTLSPSNLEGCTFTYFVPIIASPRNEFVGYCFASGVLNAFTISVNFASLNLSTIESRPFDGMYSIGVSATWSNFIHFDNFPSDSCFSTELPQAFLLVNNTLIHHSFGDRVYNPIGRINTESTCTKLQRIGECELAAYCEREVFTFSIRDEDRDNFTPNRLTADGGVFLCSPSYFVSVNNDTLTLYDRETLSPLKNTSVNNFYTEDIRLLGSCQGSGIDSSSYVVTLQATNGSWTLYTIQVTQQDLDGFRLISSGSTESDVIPIRVESQYAVVRNGTNTLIYNWTLQCEETPLSVQSMFRFVSFYSSNSIDQCRCPSNPTSLPTTTRASPTTTDSTMSPSDSPKPDSELSDAEIIGIIGFIVSCVCVVAIFVYVIVKILQYIMKHR